MKMSALKLSAADIDNMSDADLYNTLKSYGLNVGPIVASTREVYKKKLIEKVNSERKSQSPVPGLNSSFREDTVYQHDVQNFVTERSRSSVERPDSSNRHGDINIQRDIRDRQSYRSPSTVTAPEPETAEDDFELQEEDRYGRHSLSKPSTSFSSYSRQSYGNYDVGTSSVGQPRLSDYGRLVGERLHSDYAGTRESIGGNYRSSYSSLGPSTLGSSSRASFGESASARADKILEDIRRRSVLSGDYKPVSDTDRYTRTRDILEQARQSGRVSKSQTYGGRSVVQEYLLKISIGLVLFVFMYFVITSMTQSNSLHGIEQEISDIIKDSERTDTQ